MEMLFCSTVMGMPFLIPPMVLTGELFTAWSSCSQVKTIEKNDHVAVHHIGGEAPTGPTVYAGKTPVRPTLLDYVALNYQF